MLNRLAAHDNSSYSISDHDNIEEVVRVLPQKRKHTSNHDGSNSTSINNSSSSTTSSSSLRDTFSAAAAEIEAETTKFLLEIKAKRAQQIIEGTAALDSVKAQIREVALNRENETLRHNKKAAEIEQEQHKILEKLEEEMVQQAKAEATARLMKSKQKRLEWLQRKEVDDFDEQQRRDTQDYEDQRQLKLLRAKRQIEHEDQSVQFEQQQTLQRQEYNRDLHKTVVLDSLRKSKDGEANMRSVTKMLFNQQEPRKGEESESEESVEKKGQYKPFNPYA